MKKLLCGYLALVSLSSYACPELGGVDLASSEQNEYIELESYGITLTKDEFAKVPAFYIEDYEHCKDSLYVERVQDIASGKIFSALMTNDDSCDGGNSFGALYNDDMAKILGEIGDSYISCY